MRYICPFCASPLTPGDACGCEALKISELERENAELKDVIASLTEELARRTAEMELINA